MHAVVFGNVTAIISVSNHALVFSPDLTKDPKDILSASMRADRNTIQR